MFSNRNRRSGFTLPEVLVTVAIVAVLAAVVVPAVTQQLGKGDAPAFTSSVNNLRTAITSFASDVRKLPGEISQLSVNIDNANPPTTKDLGPTPGDAGVAYTENVADRWRGPYENSGSTTGLLTVGYGWATLDNLIDSTGYVVAKLTKTAAVIADATELDAAVDGGNGALTGIIRWDDALAPALTPANTMYLFLRSSAR
jgi:prepilin-type N-terminal cleavage/methylation domain-containing protein